jgi:4-amino-4-deoxy-L-arabinose transferase-like glycosyltransferase
VTIEPLVRRTPPSVAPVEGAHTWWRSASILTTNWGAVWVVALIGAFLRTWGLNSVGFNSDEAVYAGQAASIAGQGEYLPYFPIFRAHPLLFQSLLSLSYQVSVSDVMGRLLSAAFGVGTLLVVNALGRLLYGPRAGVVAMLLLAIMPYHVTVTRQVLLDGPMVFFATAALYFLARYCRGLGERWLLVGAGVMGLAFLTKETAVVLLGGVYCFFMVIHTVKVRARMVLAAAVVFGVVASVFPLALRFAGATRSGNNYLAYQLFRRANHDATFYVTTVPPAIGFAVIAVALIGLVLERRRLDWREGLLVSWCIVPIVFFAITPIKGFQYLLPIAPVVALLAARALTTEAVWSSVTRWTPRLHRILPPLVLGLTVISLLIPSWGNVQPSTSGTFLAGSGGLPGGREAGRWIDSNLPQGATFLTLGPSMANVVAFYGHRQAYGLSVSPNPLNRNPSYTAIENADLQLRSGAIQYAVWDSFSAGRSPSFSGKLMAYVNKYHGVAIHTETVPVNDAQGIPTRQPVITVYEIRP